MSSIRSRQRADGTVAHALLWRQDGVQRTLTFDAYESVLQRWRLQMVRSGLNVVGMDQMGRLVAERVKEAMERAGVSATRLAGDTGIAKVTLLRRLAGSPFQVDELHAVSLALGVPIRDLVEEQAQDVAS